MDGLEEAKEEEQEERRRVSPVELLAAVFDGLAEVGYLVAAD